MFCNEKQENYSHPHYQWVPPHLSASQSVWAEFVQWRWCCFYQNDSRLPIHTIYFITNFIRIQCILVVLAAYRRRHHHHRFHCSYFRHFTSSIYMIFSSLCLSHLSKSKLSYRREYSLFFQWFSSSVEQQMRTHSYD